MSKLAGKVAIVTGGSRGIGAAIAKRLSKDGAVVIVNYSQRAEAGAQVVAEIEAAGGEAEAIQANLAHVDQARRLIVEAVEAYGRLDILVNNAGVSEFLPLEEITEAHYAHLFDTNVRGLLFATQEAAQHLGEGGRIVNITSGAAKAAPPRTSVYSATKAAVEALTKSHAAELGARGITVNAVAPGLTATEMLDAVIPVPIQQA